MRAPAVRAQAVRAPAGRKIGVGKLSLGEPLREDSSHDYSMCEGASHGNNAVNDLFSVQEALGI